MASAAEQNALSKEDRINPDSAEDDFSEDAYAPSKKQNLKFGFLRLSGLQHHLKIRSRQQLRSNLFAELGADLNAKSLKIIPKAALEYKITNSSSKQLMILRADRRAMYIQKAFPVNAFNKVTARLQATAAVSYEGIPELHFGFDQVKPSWLLGVGAAVLLASNKTVSGGRTFGKTNLQLPALHKDSLAQGEASVSLGRHGRGVLFSFNQLNAFLRV